MRPMVGRFVSGGASVVLAAVVTGSAFAQAVYPASGQSPQQQQKDMAECQGWASQNAPNPAAVPPPQGGQGARGAARGAAVGAVGGAIGGDAGKGAAIGATTGALVGGMRCRDERRAYEQSQAQAGAAQANAFAACMQGRGSTVR
jgi:YMGG-like Gly-zipper